MDKKKRVPKEDEKRIVVRFPLDVYEGLVKLADKDERSINYTIIKLVESATKRKR